MRLNHWPRCRGTTLIMVAGVLTVLAAVAAGFYTIVNTQSLASIHYSDGVRAGLLARAGVSDAIARLREQVYENTESASDPWMTVDWRHGARHQISFAGRSNTSDFRNPASYSRALGNSVSPNSDNYTLNIVDAGSRINVNACDNLGVLLDNLCRVIGPPLVAADLDAIQPRRWSLEGSPPGLFDSKNNADDNESAVDLCYRVDSTGRPITGPDGTALYGDGYAIAGYRSRHGLFRDLADVKNALTVTARLGHPELEELERSIKLSVIREYLTVNSWVDTNTVCVGKFEWSPDSKTLIDRDKSWVADDPKNDPLNRRGSLRGSLVSIVNGHGAGQLRRIATNGIDWIQVEQDFVVQPGPISSYMIIAKDDALLDDDGEPVTDSEGIPVDDPNIDYTRYPLCIHRAPININTASDKVLTALFLGINVQHGTPLAVGTDADTILTTNRWSVEDPLKLFGRIPTLAGLKRAPVCSGKPVLDRPEPWPAADVENFGYINNRQALGSPGFLRTQNGVCNEAHELAYRIISARQRTLDPMTNLPTAASDPDPVTADPETRFRGYERGRFRSWDDLYFRVVKPWDDIRSYGFLPDPALPNRATIPYTNGLKQGLAKASLAAMIMAHFNSNTDLLKFNPNIEWIDRWGRNFTAMEPVMAFDASGKPVLATGLATGPTPAGGTDKTFYFIRNMRYRIEEMIDKSDLNRSTTEFSMDSGGVFEIQSTGQIAKNGEVRAERKVEALVHVYDVWRESTQRQFARGEISRAANQALKWGSPEQGDYSGTLTRDGTNGAVQRYALTTQPEPLVPLKYRLQNKAGGRLEECVDDIARDGRGKPKDYSIPDTIANKIMPASYDGQIVLATNICNFDPDRNDTFLASFNGDLDTDTCIGNGREQAKTPKNSRIRVCDTIGLLGLLNDTEIDIDPESYNVFAINVSLGGGGENTPLGPLSKNNYGNNVNCRMGDLRTEGVYCGIMGMSCKDGTLKYPFGKGNASAQKERTGPAATLRYQNYDPRNSTIGMWFKPLWHANDHLEHEFFNGSSNGPNANSRGNLLCKNGYVQGGIPLPALGGNSIGWPIPDGTLWALTEDINDHDMTMCLHSGTDQVDSAHLPPQLRTETPSFHTQPFRWSYVGAVFQYNNSTIINNPFKTEIHGAFEYPWTPESNDLSEAFYGFWHDPAPPHIDPTDLAARNMLRPYISTYRYPESSDYKTTNMWVLVNDTLMFDQCDLDGQPAAYPWQASNNSKSKEGCFSINNANEGSVNGGGFLHIYRQQPTDSAYSVIDELKITRRALAPKEIGAVMTTSRYYLPRDPGNISLLPTFTSQTLIQSLKGKNAASVERVRLARVSWNVFTPRFMHEYKKVGTYTHKEVIKGSIETVSIFGPFDYAQYNRDIDYDHDVGYKSLQINPSVAALGVNRPPPPKDAQAHYSKGVEVELLDDYTPIPGFETALSVQNATSTFHNPDAQNTFRDPKIPGKIPSIAVDKLRYRVRFKYPVYLDADPKALKNTVDPETQFMLDTPVFDDISITYTGPVRIIYMHEIME